MIRRFLTALFLTVVLCGSAGALPPGSPTPHFSAAETKECVVYATRTGHRYHRAACRYLRLSSIRMTRSEAIRRGLTPCLVCGGSDCD